MNNKLENLVICDAVRTPFSQGSGLKDFKSEKLLEIVLKSLLERNNLDTKEISSVVAGCVEQDTRITSCCSRHRMLGGLRSLLLCDRRRGSWPSALGDRNRRLGHYVALPT